MDYSVKSIYNLLTIIIIFVPFLVFSQDIGTDYWYISSPELRYNLTEKVEIRLRPYDGFLLSNTEKETNKFGRTELMVAYKYKKFMFFVYAKARTTGEAWIGPRVDFNTLTKNKKISLHAHYRYFTGLNGDSKVHQYVVTLFNYNLSKAIRPGILGYSRHQFGSDPLIFYGPSVTGVITKRTSVLLSYMKCLTTPRRFLTMFALNIRI